MLGFSVEYWPKHIPEVVASSSLGRPANRSQPPQQEKVVTAKRASIWPQNPVDGLLQGVANAHPSKINRFAMRTLRGKHNF
jgi:hypothetical protein